MDRRELLGVFGAAAGVAALGGLDARAAEGEHHHSKDKVHSDCLKVCGECARVCNEMAHHCMEMICENRGDVKYHARSHSLAMDCQAFCVLSAVLIARSSELMSYACDACADACRCCAEECEKSQMSEMKACAEKCRECERSCREMVQHMKTSGEGAKKAAAVR